MGQLGTVMYRLGNHVMVGNLLTLEGQIFILFYHRSDLERLMQSCNWYVCVCVCVCGSLWLAWHALVYACVWAKQSTVYTQQKSYMHACEAAQNKPKAFNVSTISCIFSSP